MKLKDIVRIVTGKTPPTLTSEYYGGPYPFITPSDIRTYHERYQNQTGRTISEKGHDYQKKLKIPAHTLCFVGIGSTVGKMCISSRDSFTNQQLHALLPMESKVDKLFLFYYVRTVCPWIKSIADAKGSGVPIINKTELENIDISVPPLPAQRKIAAILSAYDDLIENNNRRIAILEKMVEEIYREWFVRMRFPGHEKAKFHKGVPEGWCSTKLDSICKEIRSGIKARDLKPSIKYIGLEHLPRKSLFTREYDRAASVQSDKLLFQTGDILFGKIRPYLHKIALVHFAGACSSDIIVIRPTSAYYQAFTLLTVFSDTFVELATTASKGTKMPRADWDFLNKLEILEPTKDLLLIFQKRFDSIFDIACKLMFANEKMQASRDLLLSRLITGKLSIEDLDIKFPPSMRDLESDAEGEADA